MSAPQTNLDKQRRRHWAPLLGILLVVLFGVMMIVYWIGEEVAESDPPVGGDAVTGTLSEPVPSAIPTEVIEPQAQPNASESPASAPTPQGQSTTPPAP